MPSETARIRDLEARLAGVRSRGEIKALGAEADRDLALRRDLAELARRRGVEPDPHWDGKRLVRAALAREKAARERRNPVRTDAGFRCVVCGASVSPGGAQVRDHCPECLHGLHVDRVPGDRANDCGGVLVPERFELRGRAGVIIHYRCRRCGAGWRGRAHPSDRVPPSLDVADLLARIDGSTSPDERSDPRGARPVGTAPDAGDRARVDDRVRTLPRRVLEAVRRHRLWAPGDRVILAVSGGLDSTVLMEVLVRTAGAHGGRLEVVSFDHGLRPESVAEVAWVGRRARALGLSFRGLSLDLHPGPDLQNLARAARRRALLDLHGGDGVIATGHHRDDQAETVLLRLLRGSGALGLRAMRPLDPPWCRPLLDEPREVLRDWAMAEGLSWVEDPSNTGSLRGRVRELMPELDALHGGAGRALARSARLLAYDDALLDDLAQAEWARLHDAGALDLAGLQALHPALQLRLLRRLVAGVPRPVRAESLERFLDWKPEGGAALPLAAGWRLVVRKGRVRVEPPPGEAEPEPRSRDGG